MIEPLGRHLGRLFRFPRVFSWHILIHFKIIRNDLFRGFLRIHCLISKNALLLTIKTFRGAGPRTSRAVSFASHHGLFKGDRLSYVKVWSDPCEIVWAFFLGHHQQRSNGSLRNRQEQLLWCIQRNVSNVLCWSQFSIEVLRGVYGIP